MRYQLLKRILQEMKVLMPVTMEITDGANKQTVNVMGKHGMRGEPFMVQVGNSKLEISYGADPIYLPFALQLTDFQMEKYPGSMSPSSVCQ